MEGSFNVFSIFLDTRENKFVKKGQINFVGKKPKPLLMISFIIKSVAIPQLDKRKEIIKDIRSLILLRRTVMELNFMRWSITLGIYQNYLNGCRQ